MAAFGPEAENQTLVTPYAAYLIALDDEVLARKRPLATGTLMHAEDGLVLLSKRVLLPLAHKRREPAIILGGQTYHGTGSAPPHSLVLTDRCTIEELSRITLRV